MNLFRAQTADVTALYHATFVVVKYDKSRRKVLLLDPIERTTVRWPRCSLYAGTVADIIPILWTVY